MTLDPRQVLEDAAQEREGCEIHSRDGQWVEGRFVRVDKAGVVIVVPDSDFSGGEDVRICFVHQEQPWSFEASVLRAGVPVPDRSQFGLMLGFIDCFQRVESGQSFHESLQVTVLPPAGRGLELLGGGASVVHLSATDLTFTVPGEEPLKFVEGGGVRIRFQLTDHTVHLVAARVDKLSPGDGHHLYGVRFLEVEESANHLAAVEAICEALQG